MAVRTTVRLATRPNGYKVGLASPDGTADGQWFPNQVSLPLGNPSDHTAQFGFECLFGWTGNAKVNTQVSDPIWWRRVGATAVAFEDMEVELDPFVRVIGRFGAALGRLPLHQRCKRTLSEYAVGIGDGRQLGVARRAGWQPYSYSVWLKVYLRIEFFQMPEARFERLDLGSELASEGNGYRYITIWGAEDFDGADLHVDVTGRGKGRGVVFSAPFVSGNSEWSRDSDAAARSDALGETLEPTQRTALPVPKAVEVVVIEILGVDSERPFQLRGTSALRSAFEGVQHGGEQDKSGELHRRR